MFPRLHEKQKKQLQNTGVELCVCWVEFFWGFGFFSHLVLVLLHSALNLCDFMWAWEWMGCYMQPELTAELFRHIASSSHLFGFEGRNREISYTTDILRKVRKLDVWSFIFSIYNTVVWLQWINHWVRTLSNEVLALPLLQVALLFIDITWRLMLCLSER